MMARKSEKYKQALSDLRAKHADKIELIFQKMFAISQSAEDQKDAVNAAKVCVSMLGVPRPAPEKVKEPPSKEQVIEEKKRRDFTPDEIDEIKSRLVA